MINYISLKEVLVVCISMIILISNMRIQILLISNRLIMITYIIRSYNITNEFIDLFIVNTLNIT